MTRRNLNDQRRDEQHEDQDARRNGRRQTATRERTPLMQGIMPKLVVGAAVLASTAAALGSSSPFTAFRLVAAVLVVSAVVLHSIRKANDINAQRERDRERVEREREVERQREAERARETERERAQERARAAEREREREEGLGRGEQEEVAANNTPRQNPQDPQAQAQQQHDPRSSAPAA